MCFYEQYRFACGDFKWGNFKAHCNKEYRMGETCGMKLVMDTTHVQTSCKLCEKYETKLRKRKGECDRIQRWQQSGTNPASIEKAYQTIAILDQEIQKIYDDILARRGSTNPRREFYQNSYA